jgi:hypothetical protein
MKAEVDKLANEIMSTHMKPGTPLLPLLFALRIASGATLEMILDHVDSDDELADLEKFMGSFVDRDRTFLDQIVSRREDLGE